MFVRWDISAYKKIVKIHKKNLYQLKKNLIVSINMNLILINKK